MAAADIHYDVFNGDADGIFALHQFRLKTPHPRTINITGVKRDIRLLEQLEKTKNATINVFDLSFASNRDSIDLLLAGNNQINYFDHHAGEIPQAHNLVTSINVAAETCTSLIVNKIVDSAFPAWAICGAYGDNLHQVAEKLAKKHQIPTQKREQLKEIGELFNYNGYGATLADLHYNPEELYLVVMPYENPFDFAEQSKELKRLRTGCQEDLNKALAIVPEPSTGKNRIYCFPNAPWARRISGIFSNTRAREKRDAAHAIITRNSDSSFHINVRAPLNDCRDADTLCKAFPTGGGRAAAAGINNLPQDMLGSFIAQFTTTYPG